MDTLELDELSRWDDAPPPMIEEQEMDVLAFELWQRASRQDPGLAEESPDALETVAYYTCCL